MNLGYMKEKLKEPWVKTQTDQIAWKLGNVKITY